MMTCSLRIDVRVVALYLSERPTNAPETGARIVKGPAGACSAVTRLAAVSADTRLESCWFAVAAAMASGSDAQGRPVGSSTLSMTCATPL